MSNKPIITFNGIPAERVKTLADKPKVHTYTLSIWTGPSMVELIAKLTGFNAGTERVYAIFSGKGLGREQAMDQFIGAFKDAGLHGFKLSDVRITEHSEVL